MNVGIFTDTYSPDINGVVTSIHTVEKSLQEHGEHTFVVAPNSNFTYEADPKHAIWRLPSIPFYGERRFRFVLPVSFHQKEIAKIPCDIIHTQTPFPVGSLGYRIAHRRHIPLVHTYHTRYQEYFHYLRLPQRTFRIVARTGMNRIMHFVNGHDAVIAPSSSIKRELESFGAKKPITVIPTGVDLVRTRSLAEAQDPDAILKPLGISPGEDFAIFASRLGREKNIGFVIDAMAAVIAERPSARLLIVGDGDARGDLEAQVRKAGLGKQVVFAGFMTHERLFPLYRRARVFLFASLTETQGLAPLEAMALGVPTVALRATGVEDALENDHGGFLLSPSSPIDFIKRTADLLEDNDLYARKSAEAKEQAARFSTDVTTQKLIALYSDLLARRP